MDTNRNNKRNLYILSFTLLVVMLGFGIIIPILPFYITKLGASGREMGMLTSISALMQFAFAPLWGTLSERNIVSSVTPAEKEARKPCQAGGSITFAVELSACR